MDSRAMPYLFTKKRPLTMLHLAFHILQENVTLASAMHARLVIQAIFPRKGDDAVVVKDRIQPVAFLAPLIGTNGTQAYIR